MTNSKEIENIVEDYYSNLFTSQNPLTLDIQLITNHVKPEVTQDMHTKLNTPFTKDKI